MLFVIFVILLILGILAMVGYDRDWYYSDILLIFGVGLTIIFSVVVTIGSFAIVFNHVATDAELAELNQRRESIVYQYENDIYENDNDLGKRELMVDIQEWNEELARKRELQDNFWVGIFTPSIYDQLEFIELK